MVSFRRSVLLFVVASTLYVIPATASAASLPRCDGELATIVGTEGADLLIGTDQRDVIVGLGGNDRIRSGRGDDIVCGGPGRDRINGGPGGDVLLGGGGNDHLVGGSGDDELRGQRGNDAMRGGHGNDSLHQGPAMVLGTRGPLITFSVEIEARTGLDHAAAIAEVERILGDPRGWTANGERRFRRADSTSADIRVLIATPSTVDSMCAPLNTNGWLSCRNGDTAILNIDRWSGAVPHWTASRAEYRSYLVNHEVGHALGFGHEWCPGPGRVAPVMQQQTKSLQGCVANGWPALA